VSLISVGLRSRSARAKRELLNLLARADPSSRDDGIDNQTLGCYQQRALAFFAQMLTPTWLHVSSYRQPWNPTQHNGLSGATWLRQRRQLRPLPRTRTANRCVGFRRRTGRDGVKLREASSRNGPLPETLATKSRTTPGDRASASSRAKKPHLLHRFADIFPTASTFAVELLEYCWNRSGRLSSEHAISLLALLTSAHPVLADW
jgi:hypothetical protein